ncbi:MAG TPA: helix-turn-helix transcriptional regulator [Pyrinomonadaceae bacterium]|nr:helix-turn-helix transcriptional regulator [Pyrinomonadaceae bacterium]
MATTLQKFGETIRTFRNKKGLTQAQLAEDINPKTNRSVIAHLEQGRRIPDSDLLKRICTHLGIPNEYWEIFLAGTDRGAAEFESVLSELVGVPLSLESLDHITRTTAKSEIVALIDEDLTTEQTYDKFRSLLVYYGVRPISRELFSKYFSADSFRTMDSFRDAVKKYHQDVVRLFSTFEEAYETLAAASDPSVHLAILQRRDDEHYRQRAEWNQIKDIPEANLPDLGYIAAARVEQEKAEREAISHFLRDLARDIRQTGKEALETVSEKKRRKMDSLLRKFDPTSGHSLFSQLFLPDPDQLERKADQIGPKEETDIARMAQTQELAQQNLANYLSADHLDVYVATSMRSDADFVSVNRFVTNLFNHDSVRPLRLRYFNPTQSWIEDKFAKGLVEALMLRRAFLTIYMAQKEDTFGKDSEASVALGQGKPVIVYVPKLSVPDLNIDTEDSYRLERQQLEFLVSKEGSADDRDFDETVDQEALVGRLLTIRLSTAPDDVLRRAVVDHWADFDLYGEDRRIEDVDARASYRAWLDKVIKQGSNVAPPSDIRDGLVSILVATALRFERRAQIFREVHPLALQVILSSGVLNGILVARSVSSCAHLIHSVVRNELELELQVDDMNYRLVEVTTKSTIRVISKHRLLRNAFAAFYASPRSTL